MFDAVSIAPEAGVTIGRPAETVTGADFTPLPERFQETMTGVPEFKPPSITEAPIYGEPSIASSTVPSGGKNDYLAQLTDEIRQMAQRQGLDPDEPIPGENPAAELPPKKIGIGQKIKGLFHKVWNWTRRNVDEFVIKLEKFMSNQKIQSGQSNKLKQGPFAPPQPV